jgi:gas vesicle protein
MVDTRTDPGDRSVAELEREVDQERARLSQTIDALQSKVSVGNIADEVFKVMRDNGGDLSRNLGRTVRDNPLPALLAGVGLVWLMAGSGPASRRWDDDRYDDEGRYRRSPLPAGSETPGPTLGNYAETGRTYAPRSGYGAAADDSLAFGASAEADDRSGAGEALAGARERVSDAAHGIGDRVSAMAGAAGARMSEAGHAAGDFGDAARDRLHRARRRAAHGGADARERIDGLIEEQPLVLGALALALGAAIGGALPGSRTEDRMFGARSDRAKEAMREVAGEEGRKLKATAGAVVQEAGKILDEASGEVAETLPEGRGVVDAAAERVKDAATRLRDAGAEEAERQDLGNTGQKSPA